MITISFVCAARIRIQILRPRKRLPVAIIHQSNAMLLNDGHGTTKYKDIVQYFQLIWVLLVWPVFGLSLTLVGFTQGH